MKRSKKRIMRRAISIGLLVATSFFMVSCEEDRPKAPKNLKVTKIEVKEKNSKKK